MATPMRVIADHDRCEGHGMCARLSPDVFEVDDEGFVNVLVDPVPDALTTDAEDGAHACPVAALTVTTDA